MIPPPANQKTAAVPSTMTMPSRTIRLMSVPFGSDSSKALGGSFMTSEFRFSIPKATAGGPSMRMLITNNWVAVRGKFQPRKNVVTITNVTAATLVEI